MPAGDAAAGAGARFTPGASGGPPPPLMLVRAMPADNPGESPIIAVVADRGGCEQGAPAEPEMSFMI